MEFDCQKDDFSTSSTKFFDYIPKVYNLFDAAALDVVAPTELRDKIPMAWLNKLDDAHNENPSRIAFSYDCKFCMHHQNSEQARVEHQRLNNELNLNRRYEPKMEQKKNVRGKAMLSADTTLPGDDQFAGKWGNGQKKNKGRHLSVFEGYMPEAPLQQPEYVCTAPFTNDNRGRGIMCGQQGYSSAPHGYSQPQFSQYDNQQFGRNDY